MKKETKTTSKVKSKVKAPKMVKPEEIEPLPQEIDVTTNKFIVDTNLCEPFAVSSFSLPRMIFYKSVNSGEQKVKEKSTIALELYFVTQPNQPFEILKAAKSGIEKLNILFLDPEGKINSTWVFKGSRVAGIDFGTLDYEATGDEENPWNKIKVELEYDTLIVDGMEV